MVWNEAHRLHTLQTARTCPPVWALFVSQNAPIKILPMAPPASSACSQVVPRRQPLALKPGPEVTTCLQDPLASP